MILPTGQIMFTDFSDQVYVYTPAPGVVDAARPIPLFSSTLLTPTNNRVCGYNLNGLTQNNAYGDDYQGDTNFPLVRITSKVNGKVYYAFTHDDSSHSIAPNALSCTMFDMPNQPNNPPPGPCDAVVIGSGVNAYIRVSVNCPQAVRF